MDAGGVTDSSGREEAVARLALLLVPGLGNATFEALRRGFGSASAALGAPASQLEAFMPSKSIRIHDPDGWRREAERRLESLEELGGWSLPRGDPRYPAALEQLHQPPPLLFGRGDPGLLHRRIVTVVGTRRATAYGRRIAEKLGRGLSDAEVTVASGLALGIDGAAHQGALRGPGGTVAVLGHGVDRVHPRAHRGIFREIARHGLLMSEFPPGTEPEPFRFPQRNRLLAALGSATVVVEAAPGSGALITGDLATDMGRWVFGVPGPVDRPQSVGPNRLIRTGSAPVLEVTDILEPLGWAELAWTPGPAAPGVDDLNEDARAVWELLAEGPAHVDELCERSNLPPGRFMAVLTTLEVEGRIRSLPGRQFERAGRDGALR